MDNLQKDFEAFGCILMRLSRFWVTSKIDGEEEDDWENDFGQWLGIKCSSSFSINNTVTCDVWYIFGMKIKS